MQLNNAIKQLLYDYDKREDKIIGNKNMRFESSNKTLKKYFKCNFLKKLDTY